LDVLIEQADEDRIQWESFLSRLAYPGKPVDVEDDDSDFQEKRGKQWKNM
jgi:hypothetical protein